VKLRTVLCGLVATCGVAFIPTTPVHAQDSALIDALVKKGVLSGKEAEDIRATEAKEYATTPTSKLAIGDYIKQIQFYGDGRLRFDSYSQKNQYPGNNVNDRERYRLRFGLVYSYSDNLSAGFELRSGTASDTANQTFGGMFTDASINVSKIYLQYKPVDWATLIAGKFTNPMYTTTDMQWSNDLTPEGGAETLSYTFPLGGGSSVSHDPKDVKAMAPVKSGSDSSFTVGLTAGQFLYVNSNESNHSAPFSTNNNDVLIFQEQIPLTWKINKDLTVKVVPGFTNYTGGGNMNYDGGVPTNYNNVGTPPAPVYGYGTLNSSNDPVFYSPNEADDLNILSAPGEIDYKVADIPFRTYWDFDWNITAKQRVQNVYLGPGAAFAAVPAGAAAPSNATGYGFSSTGGATQAHVRSQNQSLSDGIAWAVGEQIGQNKKKGDWSILGEYRQLGLGSIDPNINGTDFANSYLNQEGVKVSGVYNFTDFLTGTVTYYNNWTYKSNLYQDLNGSSAKPLAGTTQYLVSQKSDQRVQVDLGWKF